MSERVSCCATFERLGRADCSRPMDVSILGDGLASFGAGSGSVRGCGASNEIPRFPPALHGRLTERLLTRAWRLARLTEERGVQTCLTGRNANLAYVADSRASADAEPDPMQRVLPVFRHRRVGRSL